MAESEKDKQFRELWTYISELSNERLKAKKLGPMPPLLLRLKKEGKLPEGIQWDPRYNQWVVKTSNKEIIGYYENLLNAVKATLLA